MFDRNAFVSMLKILVVNWRKELPEWGGSYETELRVLIEKTESFLENEFGIKRNTY